LRFKIMTLLICILALSACGSKSEISIDSDVNGGSSSQSDLTPTQDKKLNGGFVGFVVKKERNQILVVSPNVQDFSVNGGEKYFYSASWYSNVSSKIKIGQKVEVWVADGAKTTQYPGRDIAVDIEVIQTPKPGGASLTEEAAIRKALASKEVAAANYSWPVIKEVKYDVSKSHWTISITQVSEEKVLEIIVKDK
jgi:predicted small lipoprotein YifL